jgi:hypothetical protein
MKNRSIRLAFTGKKRSGKDTAALEFINGHGFERLLFAGTLKSMIRTLLLSSGMTEADIEYYMEGDGKELPLDILQGQSCRYAMQKLGTEWRNFFGKNLWTDILIKKVNQLNAEDASWAITDLRFLHEADWIDEQGGWKIRVIRRGQKDNAVDPHPSETEMEKINVDYTLFNHGSLEDFNKVIAVLAECILNDTDLDSIA